MNIGPRRSSLRAIRLRFWPAWNHPRSAIFELTGTTGNVVTALTLPTTEDESFKYVREAVQAYPELYFARVIVLCEGPSEEVVIPRIARAFDLDVDPRFVAVVPLGGRHVNHFWRLLRDLGTPFVTLVDLDAERDGGGWGRVHNLLEQLIALGEPPADVHEGISNERFADMPEWRFEGIGNEVEASWLWSLESEYDVFLSAPLDLDLMLLQAFPAPYKSLAPKKGGPRIPKDEPTRTQRIEKAAVAVLGDGGGDGATYDESERALFPWYSYLFLSGSKPVAHARAFSQLDDATIRKHTPDVLKRLISRVTELAADE